MKYFAACTTLDEVKRLYRQLAKQFHPDSGGDTATMQAINTEYALACAKLIKGENLSAEQADNEMKLSEEYHKVIEAISGLPGIIIELVGNWIWVTGNTYPVKSKLKAAGLLFAPKKVAWYYRAEEFKTKGGKKTLDEIRSKYGSESINPAHSNRLT